MENLTREQELLLKIYIGQNVREEGILQSEVNEKEQVQALISKGLIRENHWHLDQLLTTVEGSELGKNLVLERIRERAGKFESTIKDIPERALGFFIKRYVSNELAFSTEKPSWSDSWTDSILIESRIWILWNKFWKALETYGLCVMTYYYVSTRGGEYRDLHYVISPEIQNYLQKQHTLPDFTSDEAMTLTLYQFLKIVKRILNMDDVDIVRHDYYELLNRLSVTESQLAGIVNDMNREKATSQYHGLLSENKPFYILDQNKFTIYLNQKLINPAINILLQGRGEIKQYAVEEEIPTLSEVKMELGFLEPKELGDFYILVVNLEQQLRKFIKEKLGKGWMKRIKNDIPDIVKGWEEKMVKDKRWGIEPETDLMNYAELGDYIQIIKKYDRLFSDGAEDLAAIITHLQIWYNHGRNPIMHARTVNKQKYFTTMSAIDFLKEWMSRRIFEKMREESKEV